MDTGIPALYLLLSIPMQSSILEQIGNRSKKAFFLFQLSSNRFEYVNQAAAQIWEIDLPSILENPSVLLTPISLDEQTILRLRLEEVRKGNPQEITFQINLPDHHTKTIKIDTYPLLTTDKEVYAIAGIAEDISAQAQLEEYLQEFGHKKNSVLEIVAHDLRGPLTVIKGISDLLEQDNQQKIYEEISTYTQLIQRAYEDCFNLINQVLSDEQLRSPTIYVKKERVNVVELVQAVVNNYRMAPNLEVTIEVIAASGKIETILDEVKFLQIINNLISNSIKFTSPGGKITITLQVQNRLLLITHADNGIGIPASLQPFLFERYSRASRPGLKGEKSSGIGLAIVKELVEIQGGQIWFESTEKQGSTFYLSFPHK